MDKIRLTSPEGKEVSIKLPRYRSYIKKLKGIETIEKLDNLVEEGISYYSVKPIFDILSMSQAEQAALIGVEPRTISNWVKKDQLLGKTESMHLIELDKVIQLGVDVLGSEDTFLDWFETKNSALGNRSPKEWALRPSGLEIIEDALVALEFGSVF